MSCDVTSRPHAVLVFYPLMLCLENYNLGAY